MLCNLQSSQIVIRFLKNRYYLILLVMKHTSCGWRLQVTFLELGLCLWDCGKCNDVNYSKSCQTVFKFNKIALVDMILHYYTYYVCRMKKPTKLFSWFVIKTEKKRCSVVSVVWLFLDVFCYFIYLRVFFLIALSFLEVLVHVLTYFSLC